ncbi:hypothetical protein [Mucilaginibacter xinganensis]|uniref:Uncharacterized protein n=1 Tax=Mucilaginibacter xinganensis TaxID=1234841 RepID=A0A223P036_9SPHI|nr:hypothetical protein [Mucilaginibacter xinganensis]ASU35475.1 hypothetical protein MuYL_3590 [Mucilaginibacter xinganensis]
MKTILRTGLIVLLMLVIKTGASAQVIIDETNLITRLSGLNSLTIADAGKYFTDHNYSQFSKQTIQQPTYSMDLYKYKTKDQTDSYILSAIGGQVASAGRITYSEDEFQLAVKTVKDMDYVPGEAAAPESGKTIYAKGNMRFIIQKKAAANGNIFYVMSLSDILKTGQLAAGAKK